MNAEKFVEKRFFVQNFLLIAPLMPEKSFLKPKKARDCIENEMKNDVIEMQNDVEHTSSATADHPRTKKNFKKLFSLLDIARDQCNIGSECWT